MTQTMNALLSKLWCKKIYFTFAILIKYEPGFRKKLMNEEVECGHTNHNRETLQKLLLFLAVSFQFFTMTDYFQRSNIFLLSSILWVVYMWPKTESNKLFIMGLEFHGGHGLWFLGLGLGCGAPSNVSRFYTSIKFSNRISDLSKMKFQAKLLSWLNYTFIISTVTTTCNC